MPTRKFCGVIALCIVFLAMPLLLTAQNKKPSAKAPPSSPSYESPQPTTESLDLSSDNALRIHVALDGGFVARMTPSAK